MIDPLFDSLSAALQRSLDLRAQRQTLIAANVANVDTPGYVPVDLDFDATLKAVASGESGTAVPDAQLVYDATVTPGHDGNAVDLDHEMARMSANQVQYAAATKVLSKRLALLRYAINEGRG